MSSGPANARRLAAIVVADVVGYSRILATDEAGTLAALKERRKAVVEPLVRQHAGRIVKFMGDGVLIEFASAVNAVTFALDLQRRMAEMNEPLPEARRLVLRIGINLGEVIGEASDIFGDGVNIAARLEALSEPGGIALSGKVYEEVKGKLDAEFADLGEKSLHNVPHPVRTYGLAVKPIAASPAAKAHSEPQLISVAVLPFTNMSGDASQEYFADGLTEDLITALAKSRHLHVLSRNATFDYKGRTVNIPEVGKQLGARYVLEGSVRTGGNRVRVTVQLIDAWTGGHAWAERYDREMADIFAVQDEIVGAIAGRLSLGLVDAYVASQRRTPIADASAYDLLLQARSAWNRGNLIEAKNLSVKASEADPKYSAPLAFLAFLYSMDIWVQEIGHSIPELLLLTREFAERAVAADHGDPFSQGEVGVAYLNIGELDRAKRHLELALALNAYDPMNMMVLGNVLSCMGRHKEGLALFRKGAALEARVPPAVIGVELEVSCQTGDCDGALVALAKIDNPYAYYHLLTAGCLARAGRAEEANAQLTAFRAKRTAQFDVAGFVTALVQIYRLPEDRERLRDGFRKLGIDV